MDDEPSEGRKALDAYHAGEISYQEFTRRFNDYLRQACR